MAKILFATVLCLLFSAAGVSLEYGYNSVAEYTLAQVKGIRDVDIEIWLSDALKKETGLSEERVKNLISMKFRQSGINVTKEASDCFYINVNFVKAYCCATNIEAKLISPAHLDRNNLFVLYPSWGNSILTSGGVGSKLAEDVYREVENLVTEFLALYLEANPREFIAK